ncbi:MAG TPA: hypothetical protein VGD45_13090 [Steroidobacter sp.]|uniref:hypothetical protein n=1 Tax=Steroidobacter sp. TaxID=1978227 RepID=UPI002ED8121D
MRLELLAAAAVSLTASSAWAVDLGLDAKCNGNGFNRGSVSWNGDSYRRCDLPANIKVAGTVTLPATVSGTKILWALPSLVTVGDGHKAGKTPATAVPTVLEILAGAQVAGAPQSALVITRGAQLRASGTDVEPVVFSSLDSNLTGTGEWGGVILSSWDGSNACNSSVGAECVMPDVRKHLYGQSEAAVAGGGYQQPYYYGGYVDEVSTGSWDNLSSGSLEYVVIAEAGAKQSYQGDPLSGLALYGVSRETYIADVQVHKSKGDALRLQGGDVNVERVWLTCAGDDSVDWDQGFRGDLSFVYALQKDGSSNAFELSNNPSNYAATPVSNGSVFGVTVAYADTTPSVGVPLRLMEGTDATFTDVVIGSEYTGVCFGNPAYPSNQSAVTPSDFNSVQYACTDNAGLLPASSFAFGFSEPTFWAGYSGTCN